MYGTGSPNRTMKKITPSALDAHSMKRYFLKTHFILFFLRETQALLNFLEKEMATNFSLLAWEIPWTKESGRLQYMGSQRAGHDWVTNNNLTLACKVLLDPIPASISSLPTPHPLALWTTILALAVLWRCYFSPAPGPVHSCSPSCEAALSPFALASLLLL